MQAKETGAPFSLLLTGDIYDMIFTIIHILSCYLVFIGTWRLATATTRSPIGIKVFDQEDEEQSYNPLKDLISPHKVLLWIYQTVLSFNKPGHYKSAVILQKKFSWGLLWLLLGIFSQFLCFLSELVIR